MEKQRIALSILFIILSIGLISAANTLVAGNIYNADYTSKIEGAGIRVDCGADYKVTDSLSDGSYAVVFDDLAGCDLTVTTVSVTASKAGYTSQTKTGNIKGTINPFSIINLGLAVAPTGDTGGHTGGGGSSRYYMCGNGVCNTGETTATCPRDCPAALNPISLPASNSGTEEPKEETTEEKTEETPQNTGFLTGAAITQFVTSGAGIATIIVLIIVVGGIVTVIVIKKFRKGKKSKIDSE